MKKLALVIGAFLAFVAIVVYSTMGLRRHRVEVCIAYGGRTECRTAAAATPEQAVRTATENACALLTSGMTDTMSCQNTKPTAVRWLN